MKDGEITLNGTLNGFKYQNVPKDSSSIQQRIKIFNKNETWT